MTHVLVHVARLGIRVDYIQNILGNCVARRHLYNYGARLGEYYFYM